MAIAMVMMMGLGMAAMVKNSAGMAMVTMVQMTVIVMGPTVL